MKESIYLNRHLCLLTSIDNANKYIPAKSEDIKKEDCQTTGDNDSSNTKSYGTLMPPPPAPEGNKCQFSDDMESEEMKRLKTPLASMLPSKYVNVNVTELFPDFRPNKVLRFSRLFGAGKQSSLPQVWQKVKKRRRKLRNESEKKDTDSGSDHDTKTKSKVRLDIFLMV